MHTLYYPFHLCHEHTLFQILQEYASVHFRDFMALQLTPFMGSTGFLDRMGDYYPELLAEGKIVQGHDVSGPLMPETLSAIDRDLADPHWRSMFHESLKKNRTFQRGLVAFALDHQGRSTMAKDTAMLSILQQPERADTPYSVEILQALSRKRLTPYDKEAFEYGFGLLKTSASLVYTIRLCHQLHVSAITDSESHHRLLSHTCVRDDLNLNNVYVKREGY